MSLSERLRAAALERAEATGQHVDGVVLEPTGVLDLREMVRDATREVDNSVDLPKLPQLNNGTLFERSMTETSLWRRLRPGKPEEATPVVDVRDDQPTIDLTNAATVAPEPVADVAAPVEDEPRITAPCDRCGSTGQRDLFDRFSRTEYFSCDDCGHMWQQRGDT